MTEKNKQRMFISLPLLVCIIGILLLWFVWQHRYQSVVFSHMSALCQILVEENPEIKPALFAALKEYQTHTANEIFHSNFLRQYGYTSAMLDNGTTPGFFALTLIVTASIAASILFFSLFTIQRNKKRIEELTHYLEQVNVGRAGTMIQNREDAFSCLQDEIYKTVTNLYITKEAAVEAKERFAENLANIAHQLKTPITAALLSVQLMETTTPNAYAESVKIQLHRLYHLEENLLTLSKIDSGALILEQNSIDIYTVLTLAAENLSGLMATKNIQVDIPEKGCVAICGDMEWTMEALMNLMKNCMEHSPQDATIHCDYAYNPLYTEITIWDEGQGFASEEIPHLFERFYRGKTATGDGAGIGLALAHAIFELENGNLAARNLPAGGACFEIRIYSH